MTASHLPCVYSLSSHLMLGPALSPCSPSYSEIHLSYYTSVWPPCSQVLGSHGIGLGGNTLPLGSHQVLWKLPGSWDCSCREANSCGHPRWQERPGVWATWNLREESCRYLNSTFRRKNQQQKTSPVPPPKNVLTDPSEIWTLCEHLTSAF